MSAQIIPFPARRFVGVDLAAGPDYSVRTRPATESVPIVLVQHPGAVMLLGPCADGDEAELWLSPEQAIELGADLIRLGRLALEEGGA